MSGLDPFPAKRLYWLVSFSLQYEQVLIGAIGGKADAKDSGLNSKCYRHRNENMRPATPPNYWDPRIPDTPEGEHIETPFDYRFL